MGTAVNYHNTRLLKHSKTLSVKSCAKSNYLAEYKFAQQALECCFFPIATCAANTLVPPYFFHSASFFNIALII